MIGVSKDRLIRAISVAWCINMFAYTIAYPFLPIYLHSIRGFSMSSVGFMFLIMGLARMASPPVAGAFVDRFGRRAVLILSPAMRGIAYLVLAAFVYLDAGYWTLAALLFLVIFIGGFFQTASSAYVSDFTEPNERPEAFSRIRVGLNIGFMAGPAVGAFLARTPFASLFAVTGLLCMVTPVIVYFYCPEASRKAENEEAETTEPLLKILRKDRDFSRLLLFMFPLLIVTSQFISTLSLYARDYVGMSGNEIGMIFTVNGLLVILFQMPVSRSVESSDLATRIAIGSLFYALGFFALAFVGSFLQILLPVVIFTVGEMLSAPSLEAAASRMAPPGMVGRYMGISGLVTGLGLSVGPFLGSLLYERFTDAPVQLWGWIALSGLVAGLCFCRMTKTEALQQRSAELGNELG